MHTRVIYNSNQIWFIGSSAKSYMSIPFPTFNILKRVIIRVHLTYIITKMSMLILKAISVRVTSMGVQHKHIH